MEDVPLWGERRRFPGNLSSRQGSVSYLNKEVGWLCFLQDKELDFHKVNNAIVLVKLLSKLQHVSVMTLLLLRISEGEP